MPNNSSYTGQNAERLILSLDGTAIYQNVSSGTWYCSINPNSGIFNQCTISGYTGSALGLAYSIDQKYLYFTSSSSSSRISMCVVAATTGQLSGCKDAVSDASFNNNVSTGITFTNGDLAYITNAAGNPYLSVCKVNTATGMLNSCVDSGATQIGQPEGLTLFY